MKSKVLLVFLLCLIILSCDLFNTKKFGDVIMIEGPLMEDAGDGFFFSGRVHNIGAGKAKNVGVYIFVFDSEENQLASGYAAVDKIDLAPGENSAWSVTISDPENTIRDQMDTSRATHEITWDDEE